MGLDVDLHNLRFRGEVLLSTLTSIFQAPYTVSLDRLYDGSRSWQQIPGNLWINDHNGRWNLTERSRCEVDMQVGEYDVSIQFPMSFSRFLEPIKGRLYVNYGGEIALYGFFEPELQHTSTVKWSWTMQGWFAYSTFEDISTLAENKEREELAFVATLSDNSLSFEPLHIATRTLDPKNAYVWLSLNELACLEDQDLCDLLTVRMRTATWAPARAQKKWLIPGTSANNYPLVAAASLTATELRY